MLQYEKMDVSEGIDINERSTSKNVCFVIIGTLKKLDLNLSHVCNKCQDVLMTAYELKKHCNIKCKKS